jgi:HK97 family phage major capsid protein
MPRQSEVLFGELEEKRKALHEIFAKAKNAEGQLVLDAAGAEDVKRRNDELTELGKSWETARSVEAIEEENSKALGELNRQVPPAPFPGGGDGAKAEPFIGSKALAERVTAHALYQGAIGQKGRRVAVDFADVDVKNLIAEAKAVMTTGAGIAPESTRTGKVVLSAQRRPMVGDLMPNTTTAQAAVLFLEETLNTNAVAAVAEGDAKPESAFEFTERTANVRKIAGRLGVTDEQLDDVPYARGLIEGRLILQYQLSEEIELLTGTGVAPHLLGFYQTPGILNQNKGSDPAVDAMYKAMQKVRHEGFAEPSAWVIHPDDWTPIRLLRTADGIYIWGSPAEAGPERVWGLPIVQTPAATANKPLTGDYAMHSELARRMGVRVDAGYINDDFARNRQTLRVEGRAALIVYRPAAFATATLNA